MKMSEEMAVRLHRMMWSDMQKELGDRPTPKERGQFKFDWIHKHFPSESIASDCWLCEYASSVAHPGDTESYCKYCPIRWPNRHCNTLDFSYTLSPISEILALPAKNTSLDSVKADSGYHKFRESQLGKYSGLPASAAIVDHVAKLREQAQDAAFKAVKDELAINSGLNVDASLGEHIRAIKKKTVTEFLDNYTGLGLDALISEHVEAFKEQAVEEYFAKTPGAKLATMDVDQAFEQYADEQKAPIFKQLSKASGLSENNQSVYSHIEWIKNKARQEGQRTAEEQKAPIFRALAEASGLSAGNESVKAHISEISNKAKQNGRLERSEELFKALSVYSGVSKDDWRLQDHVEAIQIKERENLQPLREANGHMSSLITKYKDRLSDTSGLDHNRPVDDHVRAIFNNGFEAGKESARDLLRNKIEEILGQ